MTAWLYRGMSAAATERSSSSGIYMYPAQKSLPCSWRTLRVLSRSSPWTGHALVLNHGSHADRGGGGVALSGGFGA